MALVISENLTSQPWREAPQRLVLCLVYLFVFSESTVSGSQWGPRESLMKEAWEDDKGGHWEKWRAGDIPGRGFQAKEEPTGSRNCEG